MTATLAQVLNEALADEYKARDTYRTVIDRHDALLAVFAKYGIPVPPEPDPSRFVPSDSLLDACRQGVEAELENSAMYDRLLAATERADVRMVLERLQTASRDHHLPAFRRCVERGGATAAGRGGDGSGQGFGAGGGRGQGRGGRRFGRGGH